MNSIFCAHTEIVSIEKVIPNPRNPNKHPDKQIAMLAKIIDAQGWRAPITVSRRSGFIVRGHGRLMAARKLGLSQVPVDYQDYESEAAEWADLIADNRLSELSDPDVTMLKDLLQEIDTGAIDMELTAYTAEEVEQMINGDKQAEEDDFDADAALNDITEPVTKLGDIYLLGNHRLMCGDSTDAATVAALMDGAKADMVFTSPPYAQQRTYNGGMNDSWDALMNGVFYNLPITDDAQVFVNLGLVHKDGRVFRYWDKWINCMEENVLPLFGWYVWDKLNGMCGDWNGRLAPAHEWIFHFTKKAERPSKTIECKNAGQSTVGATQRQKDGTLKKLNGRKNEVNSMKIMDSVIRCAPQKPDKIVNEHPAPFPIALVDSFVTAWNPKLLYEPFAGSGTTIMCAEQHNSRCYGMELDPKYCDVIVKRWETLTGKKAEKISR